MTGDAVCSALRRNSPCVKWIDTTNAIGLIAKSGRYGGTYAHKDIAFSLSEFIWAACINE